MEKKESIMPFPFRKKGQFKDYKKFSYRWVKGVVTMLEVSFYARDKKDAKLYIDKVAEINAKNESSGS
jgi:hypothetical protein